MIKLLFFVKKKFLEIKWGFRIVCSFSFGHSSIVLRKFWNAISLIAHLAFSLFWEIILLSISVKIVWVFFFWIHNSILKISAALFFHNWWTLNFISFIFLFWIFFFILFFNHNLINFFQNITFYLQNMLYEFLFVRKTHRMKQSLSCSASKKKLYQVNFLSFCQKSE